MSWIDLESDLAEMFGELATADVRAYGMRVTRAGGCDGGVTHARRARDRAWLASLPPVEWEVPERIAKATLRLARRRRAA